MVALLLQQLKMVLFRITRAIRLFSFLTKFITNKILNSLVTQLIGRLKMDILEFISLENKMRGETAPISKGQTDLGETLLVELSLARPGERTRQPRPSVKGTIHEQLSMNNLKK